MKQQFCRNFRMASGLALLLLRLISASGQQVQRNPIVIHAPAHATTPLAFRDMTPVPWHNASKVMPEHDRAPYPHISSVPDPVTQSFTLPPVSTTPGLSFDGVTDTQGGRFVPPDANASAGAPQVVET